MIRKPKPQASEDMNRTGHKDCKSPHFVNPRCNAIMHPNYLTLLRISMCCSDLFWTRNHICMFQMDSTFLKDKAIKTINILNWQCIDFLLMYMPICKIWIYFLVNICKGPIKKYTKIVWNMEFLFSFSLLLLPCK